jgi:hypothetical protein
VTAGLVIRVPDQCTGCDGRLSVTRSAVPAGVIWLCCPAGHETMVTWPAGHPELLQVISPAHQRSVTARLREVLLGSPR